MIKTVHHSNPATNDPDTKKFVTVIYFRNTTEKSLHISTTRSSNRSCLQTSKQILGILSNAKNKKPERVKNSVVYELTWSEFNNLYMGQTVLHTYDKGIKLNLLKSLEIMNYFETKY